MDIRSIEDYPSGIQVMFQQAKELLERLDRMELDYLAWKESEDYHVWEASLEDDIVIEAPMPIQLVAPSRPEAARLRWETRLTSHV